MRSRWGIQIGLFAGQCGKNCEERRGEFSDGGEIGRARIGIAGENLVGEKWGRRGEGRGGTMNRRGGGRGR